MPFPPHLAEHCIGDNGVLRLVDSSSGRNLLPGSSSATRNPNSTSLVLDDWGNLVYGGWESFDYPTDTILSNQEINRTKEPTLQSKNGKFSSSLTGKAWFLVHLNTGEMRMRL